MIIYLLYARSGDGQTLIICNTNEVERFFSTGEEELIFLRLS